MTEFFIEYKTEILRILSFVYIPFLAFLISLAMVYLSGRMLNIVKSNIAKNVVALLSMLGSYAFYFFKYDTSFKLLDRIWYIVIYTSISVIFYVLIGFKLYGRVDALLDKVAKDNGTDEAPKKPRKPKGRS